MTRARLASALPFLLLTLIFAACKKIEGARGVEWPDPPGDVASSGIPGWTRADILHVKALAKDSFLDLAIRTREPIRTYFSQHLPDGTKQGQLLAAFYIDTDDDPETGGAPSHAASRAGYDYRVWVTLGFRVKDVRTRIERSGTARFNPKRSEYKPQPEYSVSLLMPDGTSRMADTGPIVPGERPAELTTSKEDVLTVRIPYRVLKVERGGMIRLCWAESGAGFTPSAFSQDLKLGLR